MNVRLVINMKIALLTQICSMLFVAILFFLPKAVHILLYEVANTLLPTVDNNIYLNRRISLTIAINQAHKRKVRRWCTIHDGMAACRIDCHGIEFRGFGRFRKL